MIPELLQRAVVFFRTGQAPAASVSFKAYLDHADHKPHKFDHVVVAAIHAGDWLAAADFIAEGILKDG